jgi:hypothetical protein
MAGRRRSRAEKALLRAHRQQTRGLVQSLQRSLGSSATVSVLSWGDPRRDPAFGGTPKPLPQRWRGFSALESEPDPIDDPDGFGFRPQRRGENW